MKFQIKIFLTSILLLSVFILYSCDNVEEPYAKKTNAPVDSGGVQRVLLEDYTGFTCGNCPKAHDEIKRLKEKYGDKIVVMAVHAGRYAKPSSKHPYDFRTQTGTIWDEFFGNSAAGNPNGMVNRAGFLEGEHILRSPSWEDKIVEQLKKQPEVLLDLATLYLEQSREILVFVTFTYLEKKVKYDNLVVSVVEDSIVQYQTDYRLEDKDVPDYVHNHVLRKTLNGPWGDELQTQIGIKTYRYKIPENSDWRPEKLKIIAFVHDMGNTYKVIQSTEQVLFKE